MTNTARLALALGVSLAFTACAPAPAFQSNFQPTVVEYKSRASGPPGPPFDQAAFDAMVAETDRQLAPCRAVWSLTGSPHVIDVRCPEPPALTPAPRR